MAFLRSNAAGLAGLRFPAAALRLAALATTADARADAGKSPAKGAACGTKAGTKAGSKAGTKAGSNAAKTIRVGFSFLVLLRKVQ